jgi:hypothetical protein
MRARVDVSPVTQVVAWLRHPDDEPRGGRHAAGSLCTGGADSSYRPRPPYPWSRVLDRYLEGWAEVNLGKILAATAHCYCFDDPLIGQFSRWNFPAYFEHLQARFACAGAAEPEDFAFVIRGPMDGPLQHGRLKFCREAPRLGLTGITLITIGERGIIAESVAYDLNLACHLLRV